MPHYHFVLRTRDDVIPDREGSEWPNDAAAHKEDSLIAKELMRHEEVKRGSWRVEVCDENLQPTSEVLFAEIDDRMSHFPTELRQPYILTSRRMASFSDALLGLRRTLTDVKETIIHANAVIALIAEKRG